MVSMLVCVGTCVCVGGWGGGTFVCVCVGGAPLCVCVYTVCVCLYEQYFVLTNTLIINYFKY